MRISPAIAALWLSSVCAPGASQDAAIIPNARALVEASGSNDQDLPRRSNPSREALRAGTFELRREWQGVHPRLFTDSKELADVSRAWKQAPEAFDHYFPDDETLTHLPPGNFSAGEAAMSHSFLLARMAVAVRITGQEKYAAALRRWVPKLQQADLICIPRIYEANRDLSAGHFLLGVGIAYDLLQGVLEPDEEAVIRAALVAQARQTYHDLLALPEYPYEQNHFSIPLAGLAVASMALVDEVPEAEAWAVLSRNTLARCLAAVAHDGWFFESISYWSFTLQFPTAYAGALKRLTGEDLFSQPPFRDTPLYLAHTFLPGGEFAFDFGDWGPRRNADDTFQRGYDWPWHTLPTRISLFIPHLLQRETRHPCLDGLPELLGASHELKPMDKVFLPLWQVKLPEGSAPLKDPSDCPPYHYFDDMEVVHWRGCWTDSNATALAFKSGPPAGHHIASLYPLYPEWRPGLGHAHPDAGSFLLFSQGVFLANDTGYVGKKESADHNCILVDGEGQFQSGRWNAFNSAPYEKYNRIRMTNVWLAPRLAAATALYADAYDDALQLTECRRDLLLLDGQWILIRDRLESALPHTYEWRLHSDRAARPDGRQRWRMDHGPARLVIQALAPVASAGVAPTVVETEFKVPDRKRPQQRGFHLSLRSPRQKQCEFLTALFIQASSSPVGCSASRGPDERVELVAGKERCALWIGGGESVQGDWAFARYETHDLRAVGFSGRAFAFDGLKLTLRDSGNVLLAHSRDGEWRIESVSPADNEVRIEAPEREPGVLRVRP